MYANQITDLLKNGNNSETEMWQTIVFTLIGVGVLVICVFAGRRKK